MNNVSLEIRVLYSLKKLPGNENKRKFCKFFEAGLAFELNIKPWFLNLSKFTMLIFLPTGFTNFEALN